MPKKQKIYYNGSDKSKSSTFFMRIRGLFLCLLFGHNKILEIIMEGGYSVFFTVCSQCDKKWLNRELSEEPKMTFKKHQVRIKGQGQKIILKKISKFVSTNKNKVNIYVI